MSVYAIIVDFLLVPGKRAEFRYLVDGNARASSKNEAGCRHFDVLESKAEADRVLLYEVYDDEEAFDAHVGSAHYREFERVSAPLVSNKSVIRCNLVCEGQPAGN
jgi:quinol monooxygenase YgiN